jgi:hypothetical protein
VPQTEREQDERKNAHPKRYGENEPFERIPRRPPSPQYWGSRKGRGEGSYSGRKSGMFLLG